MNRNNNRIEAIKKENLNYSDANTGLKCVEDMWTENDKLGTGLRRKMVNPTRYLEEYNDGKISNLPSRGHEQFIQEATENARNIEREKETFEYRSRKGEEDYNRQWYSYDRTDISIKSSSLASSKSKYLEHFFPISNKETGYRSSIEQHVTDAMTMRDNSITLNEKRLELKKMVGQSSSMGESSQQASNQPYPSSQHRGSLIDDFADVSTEMPSYMDPED